MDADEESSSHLSMRLLSYEASEDALPRHMVRWRNRSASHDYDRAWGDEISTFWWIRNDHVKSLSN
jgi:hypothetical protein